MNCEQYSELAYRTAPKLESINLDLLHATVGMSGEAGELIDIVKKIVFYGKPLDEKSEQHLLEEAGDLCWYLNLMLVTLGSSWEKVMAANIAKLEARYPNLKFEQERALSRNLSAESVALAGAL